jgi:hypothetical protein
MGLERTIEDFHVLNNSLRWVATAIANTFQAICGSIKAASTVLPESYSANAGLKNR